jgi:Prealbumin-like fold domain
MRHTIRLALAAVMLALTAPAGRAQGQPNLPSVAPVPPTTFTYRDADGPGRLDLFDLGPDDATGGRRIKISLTQNGVNYIGSGITLPLDTRLPLPTLIAFSLVSPGGPSYFFQGKTISGITLSGQGTYHQTGFPENSATWSIVLGGGGGGGGTSGIQGIAVEGPISPVERPGVPNTRPLAGAIITVQPAGGGQEIARQATDANGQFQIALNPGTYLIVPLPPQPGAFLPRGTPQTVTVPAGAFVNVTVQYDTGIR